MRWRIVAAAGGGGGWSWVQEAEETNDLPRPQANAHLAAITVHTAASTAMPSGDVHFKLQQHRSIRSPLTEASSDSTKLQQQPHGLSAVLKQKVH